jgi:hypothetical protein
MEQKLTEDESRVLAVLSTHIGREKALDMGQLYHEVFDEEYSSKINGTKPLRMVVTSLRDKGFPIGSSSQRNGGGYYLCRSGTELNEYCERLLHWPAMRKLKLEARLRKISMAELLGQMAINLEGSHEQN